MDVLLTIGEFSKMTYLSVKALRHYHDIGLLEPIRVDPSTGYRRYGADQVGTAQAIRRFRDLDMPIDEVRQVLQAPDLAARNRAILVHLERMHEQLEQTQAVVASLQKLLTDSAPASRLIHIRRIPATRAVITRTNVSFVDCAEWLEPALNDLHGDRGRQARRRRRRRRALPDEIASRPAPRMTAFVPIAGDAADAIDLPATTVASSSTTAPCRPRPGLRHARHPRCRARHRRTGTDREHYLTETSTEVCWPVTTGATR